MSIAGLGAVLLFLLALSVQKIWAADIWWQIRTGEWIASHHAVPTVDVLSYTVAGHPWIEMRWLFCLAAWILWRTGGPAALILVQTAMLVAAWVIAAWPARRTAATPLGILLLAAGVFSASSRYIFRPELVSYICIGVYLGVLHELSRGRFRRMAWSLPFVQIVWTNAHTLFAFGPGLIWLYAAGESVRRISVRIGILEPRIDDQQAVAAAGPRPRSRPESSMARLPLVDARLLLLAVLVTAACFVNPYGFSGAAFPFLLLHEIHKGSILGTSIREFLSPLSLGNWTPDLYVASALLVAVAITFVLNRRRVDPSRLAVWGPFVYLAGVSLRNVAPCAVVSVCVALRNLQDFTTAREERRQGFAPGPDRRDGPARPTPLSLIAICAIGLFLVSASWYVASDHFYIHMGAPRRFGLGIVEWNTPARAVDFLLEARPKAQVFSSLADGSYMTWWAKDRYPVFTDGRLEVYGEDFYQEYQTLKGQDWTRFADRHGINVAVIERQYFGWETVGIAKTPGWVLVHVDPRELVFVRDIPEHADLIQKYRIDPKVPWTPRAAEPDERPKGWRVMFGSVEEPWYCLSMARNFLALGAADNAARFLRLGLERFPGHPAMTKLLEQIRPHLSRGVEPPIETPATEDGGR